MKTFLITILFMFGFNGCSTKNAFSDFNITQEQEMSEENTLSSKIQNEHTIDGVITAVYLNKAMPDIYKENEYFYVYLYTKHDNKNISFLLNGDIPLKIEELKTQNMFTHLTSFKAEWGSYYLLVFKSQKDKLSFSIKNAQFSSNKLEFKKEDE